MIDVPAVPKDEIIDTLCAGDAFMGGLLAKLALGGTMEDAVVWGHKCAAIIIRQVGCSFPEGGELPDPDEV